MTPCPKRKDSSKQSTHRREKPSGFLERGLCWRTYGWGFSAHASRVQMTQGNKGPGLWSYSHGTSSSPVTVS